MFARDGGGKPGGAERPGGTAGAVGCEICDTSGVTDAVASGGLDATSDSTATDDVGDLGGGAGTGGTPSFVLLGRVVAGVTGLA